MTYIYNKRGILLIFIISIYFSNFSKAQDIQQDSVVKNNESVRNIAYGTQPLWMITSSTSAVKGPELQKMFTSNLGNTLYGRLPGLTVRQGSGEPGTGGPAINVRGISTYGAATTYAPLVMVDGFESSYEWLTPEEIESIVLLKDAAATALYGNRAANGVLLITTKRGKQGPLSVNFSTQQGFQNAQGLPNFLGSYDYARLYNEALQNDGQPTLYSQEDLSAYKTGSDPFFHPDVNWYNQVLRKAAPISNYDLNFRGGGTGVKYFVLFNALTNSNLYKRTASLSSNSDDGRYSRYNLRTNVDLQLTKRLSFELNLGGAVEDRTNPAGNTTDNTFNLLASLPPNSFPVYNPDSSFGGNALYSNPYGDILQSGFYTSNARTFQSSLRAIEQLDMITKGLSISAAGSFNNYFRNYSNKTRTYTRYFASKDPSGNIVYTQFGANTNLASDESIYEQWRNSTIEATLNYNRTFGRHLLNFMTNFNSEQYVYQTQNITTQYPNSNGIPFRHIGFGGRFTYAYNEKYIGEATFGYYGSENFPEGKHFGLFPAISAGWIISKESFLKDSKIFNYLKLRGSYGLSGNDNIGGGRFSFAPDYPGIAGYVFGTNNTAVGGRAEGAVANTNLTWEKQKQADIGIEVTAFKNLNLSIDLFNIDRYDILAQPNATIPQYTGIILPSLNVGKVNNKGFEAMLRYNSNPEKKLLYYIETDFWYAKNELVYNAEPIQKDTYLYLTGQPIGQPFLLKAIGFFKDAADIANSPTQTFAPVQPGDIKYQDQNNDNVIDQNDFYPIGNSDIPQLTAGVGAGFKYKGFNLDVFFQGVMGRSVYLGGNYFQAFQNNGQISEIALGRWTPETAETAAYPRLSSSNNMNNYQNSSFWQRNGNFIKLRSAQLGYQLPGQIVKKIGLDNAGLFLNGTNLFSLDHVKYTDPETLSGYPALRTFSIGANIRF